MLMLSTPFVTYFNSTPAICFGYNLPLNMRRQDEVMLFVIIKFLGIISTNLSIQLPLEVILPLGYTPLEDQIPFNLL